MQNQPPGHAPYGQAAGAPAPQSPQYGYGVPHAPSPAAAPAPAAPATHFNAATGKGFFKSLFDLSFSTFVTSRLVKVIYLLLIIASIGSGLATAFSGATTAIGGLSEEKSPYSSLYQGSDEDAVTNPFAARRTPRASAEPETRVNGLRVITGIALLLASPLVTLFSIVVSRVYMELVIVLFRIAENIGEINLKTRA